MTSEALKPFRFIRSTGVIRSLRADPRSQCASVLMQLPRPIITQVTGMGMGMDLYFSIFDGHIARGGHERGPDVVRLLTADYSTSAPPALVLRRSACVESVTILKN